VKTVKRRRRLKIWRLMKMMGDGYQVFPSKFGFPSFHSSVDRVFSGAKVFVESGVKKFTIWLPPESFEGVAYVWAGFQNKVER